jgi:hypothetical protein
MYVGVPLRCDVLLQVGALRRADPPSKESYQHGFIVSEVNSESGLHSATHCNTVRA